MKLRELFLINAPSSKDVSGRIRTPLHMTMTGTTTFDLFTT